jgi:hypothetical protein
MPVEFIGMIGLCKAAMARRSAEPSTMSLPQVLLEAHVIAQQFGFYGKTTVHDPAYYLADFCTIHFSWGFISQIADGWPTSRNATALASPWSRRREAASISFPLVLASYSSG